MIKLILSMKNIETQGRNCVAKYQRINCHFWRGLFDFWLYSC